MKLKILNIIWWLLVISILISLISGPFIILFFPLCFICYIVANMINELDPSLPSDYFRDPPDEIEEFKKQHELNVLYAEYQNKQ